MAINLSDKYISNQLMRHLSRARSQRHDSMEKLASGKVFSSKDPRPAERALTEQMEFRIRSLSASKRNISNAISLLQTAESGLSEINNIILRMKEINVAAATTTVSDQERRYLFFEYEALHDELNRIAFTTEYNGLPLLNGEAEEVPEELVFRIDDPFISETTDEDINTLRFEGLKSIVATTDGLGLRSARELLVDTDEEEGLELEDVEELMEPEEDVFATVYDEALNRLSTQRAVFGAMQNRLNTALNYQDVYQENIAAAKSSIADTDYAQEIVKLTEANILMQASSGLLAQTNFDTNITLNLLSSVIR